MRLCVWRNRQRLQPGDLPRRSEIPLQNRTMRRTVKIFSDLESTFTDFDEFIVGPVKITDDRYADIQPASYDERCNAGMR